MHLIRAMALGILSVALAGCAAAPSVGIEDPNTKIPDNAGLVAVQVVSNSEQLSDFLTHWTALFLIADQPGAEALYLQALDSPDLGTDVFVGAVAPGRYRLILLQAFENRGDVTHRLRAPAPGYLGTFDVESGALTNLGTLIAQPLEEVQTKSGPARRFVVSRSDKPADMRRFIEERLPNRLSLLRATQERSWSPDGAGPLRDALTGLLRSKGLPRGVLQVGDTGNLMAYGRLGQTYFRNPQGQWTAHALPTELEIYSAARLADGHIALGGERGAVFIAGTDAPAFEARPLTSVFGPVYAMHEATPGTLVAVVLERDHLDVFVSTDLGTTWRNEYQIPRKQPGFIDGTISFPTSYRRADGSVVVLIDGKGYRRAPGGGTWEVGADVSLTRLVLQQNRMWVGVPRDWLSGEGAPMYSTDEGRTWNKTSIHIPVVGLPTSTPYLFSDRSVLVPKRVSILSALVGSHEGKDVELLLSTDYGKTTKPHGSVPYGCDRLRGDISRDDLIFALCNDGRMFNSRDGGKTFELEFDPTLRWADVIAALGQLLPKEEGETAQ